MRPDKIGNTENKNTDKIGNTENTNTNKTGQSGKYKHKSNWLIRKVQTHIKLANAENTNTNRI